MSGDPVSQSQVRYLDYFRGFEISNADRSRIRLPYSVSLVLGISYLGGIMTLSSVGRNQMNPQGLQNPHIIVHK
jgi:hypothetical protein